MSQRETGQNMALKRNRFGARSPRAMYILEEDLGSGEAAITSFSRAFRSKLWEVLKKE